MRYQGATLLWGKAITPDNPLLPRGMQDALTPGIQTLRNILTWVSWIAVPIVGILTHNWWAGLLAFVAAFLGSGFAAQCLPKSNESFLYRRVLHNLKRRREAYSRAGDTTRAVVATDLLERMEAVSRGQ